MKQSGGRSGCSSGQCAHTAPTYGSYAKQAACNSAFPPSTAQPAGEHTLPLIKGGLLLDVFAGIHAPISAAADKQGLARFEAFDLDANAEHDILLMRISWSGIVSTLTLAHALPHTCKACLTCLPRKSRVAQSRETQKKQRTLQSGSHSGRCGGL